MPSSNVANEVMLSGKPEKFIDKIDPEDPDYQKILMRPAAIKEDVNLMIQRQRVSGILKSDAFRRELEEVVRSQCQSGDYPGMSTSLLSLQHISDLFTSAPSGQPASGGGFSRGHRSGVIPINDLRGGDATVYSRRERSLRCKLASVYRLIDLFGWNSSIYNHVTVCVSRNHEHYLVNPFGLLYHEITASSLIKVDSKGQILDPGSTILGVNQVTWALHSAVHSARADIRCIIHLDTPSTVAISCMKSGLLPLCNEAMILGEVAYYTPSSGLRCKTNFNTNGDFSDAKDWAAECATVSEALGPTARILFLRSFGLLALGETIEEAWHYATNAIVACDTQLLLASVGAENLILPTDKLKQKTYETWRTAGLGGLSGPEAALAMRLSSPNKSGTSETGQHGATNGFLTDGGTNVETTLSRPWRLGELEFEAMMRHLDNAGCRTGHLYRQEAMASPHRPRKSRPVNGHSGAGSQDEEILVPPSASSVTATMAYYYDDGVLSGDETETPRPSTLRREFSDKQWFNTPNKYTKEVIEPAPGHQPVSHWVCEREAAVYNAVCNGALPPPAPFHPLTHGAVPLGSTGGPATGTSSITSPYNVFAPQGSNPKEYRDQQKKVKAKYYHDTNTAGPQSRLLDGLTWDEARRVRDEGLVKVLGPRAAALVAGGVASEMPVAAASKAIIQRDVRNAAVIYDGLYSHQNPFEKITDEELEMYRREIELKNNPDLVTEMDRHHLTGQTTSFEAPSTTTHLIDSLAADSGATDLESASELGPATHSLAQFSELSPSVYDRKDLGVGEIRHSETYPVDSPATGRLAPPPTTGTLTSEPSGTEDMSESDVS
ncbi:Alpha-adducin [Schistosoma japonicum]|nr:Alpha-adducin [Schistosoma japonicum]